MGGRDQKDPLLPRWAVTTLALVVLGGWIATVAGALSNPANAGSLITVSGLLMVVLSAVFGLSDRFRRRNDEPDKKDPEDSP